MKLLGYDVNTIINCNLCYKSDSLIKGEDHPFYKILSLQNKDYINENTYYIKISSEEFEWIMYILSRRVYTGCLAGHGSECECKLDNTYGEQPCYTIGGFCMTRYSRLLHRKLRKLANYYTPGVLYCDL